jgi:hypothetical protein
MSETENARLRAQYAALRDACLQLVKHTQTLGMIVASAGAAQSTDNDEDAASLSSEATHQKTMARVCDVVAQLQQYTIPSTKGTGDASSKGTPSTAPLLRRKKLAPSPSQSQRKQAGQLSTVASLARSSSLPSVRPRRGSIKALALAGEHYDTADSGGAVSSFTAVDADVDRRAYNVRRFCLVTSMHACSAPGVL